MTEEDKSDVFANLETELSPTDVHGWNIDKASSYKIRETARMKRRWEMLLNHNQEISLILAEVDTILTEDSKSLVGHLSGNSFVTISHSDDTDPDSIVIRLIHEIEELQRIENHFFQNISDDRQYRIKGSPVVMETGNPYKETVELQTEFSNIEVHMPTLQSFYDRSFSERLTSWGHCLDS